MHNLEISSIDIKPLRAELSDLYAPADGSDNQLNNLMIVVKLKSGHVGYGEIAPSEALTGETLHGSRQAVLQMGESIRGLSVDRCRAISHWMKERVPALPATRCGMETAMLDAFCRALKIPMWAFFGGKVKRGFVTDMVLPLLSADRTLALAKHWDAHGFDTLKMKVGVDLEEEINIVSSIHEAHPAIRFIFDAGQSFTEEEAILFITEVIAMGCEVVLFEQPLHREDLEGMARIRREVAVPLVADESVLSLQDLKKVIARQAADVINIKIMKSGLLEAVDIAVAAKAMDMKLMLGGMRETRLAVSCSLSLAAGLGSVNYFDVGRPLLLRRDPFTGGFEYADSELKISDDPGMGLMPIH